MIAAVVVLGMVVLVLLALKDRERKSNEAERQLLLERIQAPERVNTISQIEEREPLETDGSELALVGAIVEGEEQDG